MFNKLLRTALLIFLGVISVSCQPIAPLPSSTPKNAVQDIRVVLAAEPIKTIIDVEQFQLPNCGGSEKLTHGLRMYASATQNATVGAKASVKGGGEAAIPETVKLKLEIQVEASYQKTFESTNSRLDSIEMSAAAGTHVIYAVVWEEQAFTSIVRYSSNDQVHEVPYTYKLVVPKIDKSYNVACPGGDAEQKPVVIVVTATAQPQAPIPPTSTRLPPTPVPAVNMSFVQEAIRRCQEFRGNPVPSSKITNQQIDAWRQVGKTAKPEVARIIYCEIHQVPGMNGFVEGVTIPANVIITADLGFNWQSVYPGALERLIHEGGGWGVFLSLKPFRVQHANDLPNAVGGQFWFISE